MGKALIKANVTEVVSTVKNWAQNHKLTVVEFSEDIQPSHFQAKGLFFAATCQIQPTDDAVAVSVTLKLRLYVSVMLNIILLVGLYFATTTMRNVSNDFNAWNILKFVLWSIFLTLTIRCKYNKLTVKLARLESSFWNFISTSYDTRMVTHSGGQIETKGSKLSIAVVGSCWVVYVSTMFFGTSGFSISTTLCLFILVGTATKYLRNNNPHWDWHFWIIDNMSSWMTVMLTTLVIAIILLAFELLSPLRLSGNENISSVTQAIRKSELRTVFPVTSESLEKDCEECFYKLSELDIPTYENINSLDQKDIREQSIKKGMYYYSLYYLMIMTIAIYLFSIRPLRSLLKAQEIWVHETGSLSGQQGPFVPYMPHAWKWATPSSLRALILLNWFIGGIINVAAVVFCIDSASYLLKGQALFFEKTVNLWSWVFVASKTLFGIAFGQGVGTFFIIIVCLPVLILFVTFIRRGALNIFLMMKIIRRRFFYPKHKDAKILPIESFVGQTCTKYGIAIPMITLIDSQDIIIRLQWIPFSNETIIELSSGTVELLTLQELETVVMHEIGHIRQGLWKVSTLKLLSSLAMFPNYYLTLCVDWAKKEMDADQFAITATKDTDSLKQALIKISTAQISCSILATDSSLIISNKSVKVCLQILKKKLHSVVISVNFFFGDRLFGYVHPYLSERLEAIETKNL